MKVGIITTLGVVLALIMGSFTPEPESDGAKQIISTPVKAVSEKPVTETPAPVSIVDDTWTASAPINGVPVESLNNALAIYKGKGLSKAGAAYLIGNFAQESPSAFRDPCLRYGDGGRALGFGQWWEARRVDMPCTVNEQLVWAFDVEMPRDARHNGYATLSDRLRGDDIQDIMNGIKRWERYGIEGKRFIYGQQLLDQIK